MMVLRFCFLLLILTEASIGTLRSNPKDEFHFANKPALPFIQRNRLGQSRHPVAGPKSLPVIAGKPKNDKDSSYIRACYFTNWAHYRLGTGKYEPSAYIPGLCTHILFAFATIGEDFKMKPFDEQDEEHWGHEGYLKLVNDLKNIDPGLKTLISIGGFTFGTRLFKALSSNAANRQTFINSAISFVRSHGYDGLDIDWEYPDATDKNNFVALLQETRSVFNQEAQISGKPNLLFTLAVPVGVDKVQPGYDIPNIARYVDFINLMSYDYHGIWESVTGLNAPLYGRPDDSPVAATLNLNYSALYWVASGMPKNKIVIGIPTYGRGWKLANPANSGINVPTNGASPQFPYSQQAGIGTYYEICKLASAEGTKRIFDSYQLEPYIVTSDGVWFGYEDVESISHKMGWLKSNGFAGAMIWTLDMDDFNGLCPQNGGQKYPLINAVNQALAGKVVTSSPTSSFPSSTTITSSRSSGPTTTTTTVSGSSVSTTIGGPFTCPGDGLVADPTDCSKFYSCTNGNAFHLQCPLGLYFNPKILNCDWPANVDCKNKNNNKNKNKNKNKNRKKSKNTKNNKNKRTGINSRSP